MQRHVSTRVCGAVILIAGIWGALIPFVGPYFHFVLGPDQHWHWTNARLWLNVVPGAVAVIGGLMLLGSGPRPMGKLGALLGIAAGAWFAIGPDVSMLWNHGVSAQGAAHGHHTFKRMLEHVTFHSGLGVLIVAFSAFALPGVLVARRNRVERDAAAAGTGAAVGAAEAHHRERVAEREAVTERQPAAQREPVAQREPMTEREPAADRAAVAEREPMTDRESVSNGGTSTASPAGGGTATATEAASAQPAAADGGAVQQRSVTRRRGGLLGRLSGR
jgi:hypothetical protein